VAQECRFYPIGADLSESGTAFLFQTQQNGSALLNGQTITALYSLQGTSMISAGVANWPSGTAFRAVRLPSTELDVSFLPTDWSTAPTIPGYWNFASPIWCVFAANGCAPGQPFRVEIHTVYEYVNNIFSFATPNSPGLVDLGMVHAARRVADPHLADLRDVDNIAGAQVLQTLANVNGPRHVLGALGHAQKGTFGDALKGFAEKLLPKLFGMGMSVLSDGLIPPSMGEIPATLAIEGITEQDSQAYEPATPPSTIEEPDVVTKEGYQRFVVVPDIEDCARQVCKTHPRSLDKALPDGTHCVGCDCNH
jgi:hypothetical protein